MVRNSKKGNNKPSCEFDFKNALCWVIGGFGAFFCCTVASEYIARYSAQKQSNQPIVSIVLYENGRALVSEKREMFLEKGTQNLFFGEMPKQLILPSATVSGKNITLQSVNFNPADQQQSYFSRAQTQAIGQPVTLFWEVWKDGKKQELTKQARLLATEYNEPVLLIDGKVQKGTDAKILYPKPTKEQNTKPELTFTVSSNTDKLQQVDFSYMATGFGWNTFYNLYLNEAKNTMDIQGQVNLTNNSGVDYKNVNLDFVLGDVHALYYDTPVKPQPTCEVKNESGIHIASKQMIVNGRTYRSNDDSDEFGIGVERARKVRLGSTYMVDPVSGMVVGSINDNIVYDLKDFYVYHLPFEIQLINNAPTMATFLSGKNIPYKKEYLFTNLIQGTYHNKTQNVAPQLYITFDTKALNLPLPKGDFRVFNKRGDQSFFMGESRVNTITMPNQKAKVNMGNALDIYADTQLVDFREISDEEKLYTYEIVVRNLAKEQKQVKIQQALSMGAEIFKNASEQPSNATPIQLTWEFKLKPSTNKTIRFTVLRRDLDLIRRKQEKQFDDELCKNKIIRVKEN